MRATLGVEMRDWLAWGLCSTLNFLSVLEDSVIFCPMELDGIDFGSSADLVCPSTPQPRRRQRAVRPLNDTELQLRQGLEQQKHLAWSVSKKADRELLSSLDKEQLYARVIDWLDDRDVRELQPIACLQDKALSLVLIRLKPYVKPKDLSSMWQSTEERLQS